MNFGVAILTLKMEENTGNAHYFWHIMLYYFKEGKNITATLKKKICVVCGEGAVTGRTCQRWFATFPAGDSSLGGSLVGGTQ